MPKNNIRAEINDLLPVLENVFLVKNNSYTMKIQVLDCDYQIIDH